MITTKILMVHLAGLIGIPLSLCSRYAFSLNDPLPEQRGKTYGCTLSAQAEQKKLLAVLDCIALNNKGQPSTLKAAHGYVFGMLALPA
jgi:hypothetical protein